VPGRYVHDLRRTAVRTLVRAGVSRSVAMKLTGHKTESIYRRYAIVNEADLSEGLQKVAALSAGAARPRTREGAIAGGANFSVPADEHSFEHNLATSPEAE
jgi:hypothetical protein